VTGFGPSAASNFAVSLDLANVGRWASSGTHFWVYANSGNPNGPWPYTVAADSSQTVTVDIGTGLGAGIFLYFHSTQANKIIIETIKCQCIEWESADS
jgi:Domain of unknown function (DUF756)